ncbi:MAG: hypothetical protein FJZ57_00555 [Chlamydiae bacterium]|nr:hypothetical protein [Chlamydiota bacterium]
MSSIAILGGNKQYNSYSLNLTNSAPDQPTQVGEERAKEIHDLFPDRELSLSQRITRAVTHPIALCGLFQGHFKSLFFVTGVKADLEHSKTLLLDIGGEEIKIPSSSGSMISAMYFSAEKFHEHIDAAFIKWKAILEANPRLTAFWEADLEGSDLRELMRLPETVLEDCSSHKKVVVRCIGANNLFEANPQSIFQHLYRGIDHLAFNYQGLNDSTGTPSYEATCADAYNCTKYIMKEKGFSAEQILMYGTSMGGGPALFTASKIEGTDVFVDRTFSRLSAVRTTAIAAPIFRYLAENFYPFPNEEWIKNVKGRACVLHGKDDSLIDRSHADRLVISYVESRSSEAGQDIAERSFIEAKGGHYGPSSGDADYSWYADAESQKKFSNFIKDKTISDNTI